MSNLSIKHDYVVLSVSDGTTMNAYTAMPSVIDKPLPGLILFQEAFGVNHHIRNLTERFAAEGYVVIAPELYHRTAPQGFEGSYTDFPALAPHFQGISDKGLEADARGAWDWLQKNTHVQHDAVGCIGYCMGGRVSFLTNTILPVKAAISYYGGRIVPDLIKRAPDLHAPMLFFWGGLDKHISREQIEQIVSELEKAGKLYTNVQFSYADHAFFCDTRASYNKQAAKESWVLTLAFMESRLKMIER
jgi:carboxymethylenebutenolidase